MSLPTALQAPKAVPKYSVGKTSTLRGKTKSNIPVTERLASKTKGATISEDWFPRNISKRQKNVALQAKKMNAFLEETNIETIKHKTPPISSAEPPAIATVNMSPDREEK